MKRKLKTITLGYADNPTVSICRGHVTVKEFNDRYRAEGWSGDRVRADELHFEFWIPPGKRTGRKRWKHDETEKHPQAIMVTAMYW